jgi:hypothetical protein
VGLDLGPAHETHPGVQDQVVERRRTVPAEHHRDVGDPMPGDPDGDGLVRPEPRALALEPEAQGPEHEGDEREPDGEGAAVRSAQEASDRRRRPPRR